MIHDVTEVLMLSHDSSFYGEMNRVDLNTLRLNQYEFKNYIFKTNFETQCLHAIMNNLIKNVDKLCHYNIVPNEDFDISFIQEQQYHFLHVDQVTLSCGNKNEKIEPGCNSCVFVLPQNCSLKYKNIFIPQTLGHADSSTIERGYTLPLPLLKKVYSENESFDQILATQSLLPVVPTYNFPKMAFFRHEMQEKIASLEKSKIPIQTAVARMKENKVVLETLTQAIVTGELQTVDLSFWITPQGALVQTSIILIGLLLALNAYFIFKMRSISIALLLLQQHITDTKAQSTTNNPSPLEFNFFPKNAQTQENTSIFSFTEIENKMEYFVIIIIAITLGLYFIKRLLKKIKKHCDLTLHSYLVIQCTYNSMTLYIKWLKLFNRPEEYFYESMGPMSNLKIDGWYKPMLSFDFVGFRVTHKLTQVTQNPATTFQVSIFQAAILKYFLTRDKKLFYFFPIHTFENSKFAMTINNLKPLPIETAPNVNPPPRATAPDLYPPLQEQ